MVLGQIRDPKAHGRRRIILTPTIHYHKLKMSTLKHIHGTSYSFTLASLPFTLFNLPKLLATIGIYTNALQSEYKSVDDMLNRLAFEYTHYIKLKWENPFQEKKILDMTREFICEAFLRILLVVRVAVHVRLYACRVFDVSALQESLARAVAGFFICHTATTAENYDIPNHMKHEMAHKIFKKLASDEKPLFDAWTVLPEAAPRGTYLYHARTVTQRRETHRRYCPKDRSREAESVSA
ncbi:hypothetical protein CONLIGDRAFT_414614 [Coniochaeta ligniaria NRRL 30616]|uniref:Uncharacterized protein n=1 Tax=Coniochaeta ligniaria NRRL 30616 TaxID=1408157 RepID=A0A1J7I3N7_9PEZI|nr:hypothetical protein CONLIGDRAFT_414614 [Coniochaeta ligniaria NRRL 30616]